MWHFFFGFLLCTLKLKAMKEQNRSSRQDHRSVEQKGGEVQRSGQQAAQQGDSRQPGTSRNSDTGREHKGRRHTPFVPLDKDDIY